jgi:glycerol-3-phosphate dehydrogenase (NAD(P)+)
MKISVLGAGAWGTAIANILAENNKVMLYAREKEVVKSINGKNINEMFLPDVKLNENVVATDDFEEASSAEYLFLVPPSQFLRKQLEDLNFLHPNDFQKKYIICSKGIENNTLLLMTDIFHEFFPNNEFAILSGPTFAIEAATKKTTSVSISSRDINFAEEIVNLMETDYFSLYPNRDVVGSEICGAVKNVIAIACGIASGIENSENLKAAVISKGFKEIVRLNKILGGRLETLAEPCGIGDLVLTCNSTKSRNFSFGLAIGKDEKENFLKENNNQVVEGVATAESIAQLCERNNVRLPLCLKIHEIVSGSANPKDILEIV